MRNSGHCLLQINSSLGRVSSCDAGNYFHSPWHRREVFFLSVCELIFVDAKCRHRRRHGDMLLCRCFKDQPKILVHQAQRKLRAVIVNRRSGQLSKMSRGDYSCL